MGRPENAFSRISAADHGGMWRLIAGHGTLVVVVDIGSVQPTSRFAWAAFDAPGRDLIKAGEDPETAVLMLASGLVADTRPALLLKAPMAVPVPGSEPDAWLKLGEARDGEGNRLWSAGAGPERWRPG